MAVGRQITHGVFVAVCLGFVAPAPAQTPAAVKAEQLKEAPEEPKLVPGKTVRIHSDKIRKDFLVYLPPDYTPERKWPVIFSYHGMGGRPTVHPFDQLTNGKNFIIVGMPYVQQEVNVPTKASTWAQYEAQLDAETRALTQLIMPFICKRLSADKRLLFVGGTSRGGWVSGTIGENAAGICAGIIILCAGRERYEQPLANPQWFRNKPIFIGVGEKEKNRESGEKAARFYALHGAKVTLEIFKGLGHQVDVKNERLRMWLLANGPLRYIQADLAEARRLAKSGKLGKAHAIYHATAGISDTHTLCQAAGKACDDIAEKAEAELSAAQKCAAEKRYGEASRLLVRLAETYEGCPFGLSAKQQLQRLNSDPAIQAAIAQAKLDDKADKLEARARAAEGRKDYAAALRLYEQYIGAFAKAHRFEQVRGHLQGLKADKAIMALAERQRADQNCRGWLGMADNYIRADLEDKALPYLRKIIETYPQSEWAAKARQRLERIDAAK